MSVSMQDALDLITLVALHGDNRTTDGDTLADLASKFLKESGHFAPARERRHAFLVYHTKDNGPGRKRIDAASVFAVRSTHANDPARDAMVMVSGGQWIAAHYFAQGLGASGWIVRTAHYHGTDPVETAPWENGDGGIYANLNIG